MGRGSVLKNLKSQLQSNDLLRHQKRKKGDQLQQKQRKERDNQNLNAIREAFNPFNSKIDHKKKELKDQPKVGNPVAARSAAESQRTRTWDAEKRLRNKVGGLVDRRFGERDKTMSEEDKMVERFSREKLNHLRKANRKSFNIEDNSDDDDAFGGEEILTHGGHAISFHDDFAEEDLGVDDDDDGEEPAKKKARLEESRDAEEEKPERPKTKAEVMQEIIAKSKMYKHERQQQKQADEELIDSLNADFDELMADLATTENERPAAKRDMDTYDRNIQELAFERRADPSDRTKTEEELSREREEKRVAAERAKTSRMEGDELDIEVDDVRDDAHLFGLQDVSDNESLSHDEVEDDTSEARGASTNLFDNDSTGRAESARVPQTLEALQQSVATAENVPEKIRHFVEIVTPGRGSGSKEQLQNLSVAILELAISNKVYFKDLVSILHDVAPNHEVGLVIANRCRDLVHIVRKRPSWGTKEQLLFSVIGSIFSTSDQWHVVATSATLVCTQRLSQSVDTDLKTISANLLLCDILLNYQRLSKRYIPEVSGYLLRILALFPPKHNITVAERYVRMASSSPLPPKKFKEISQKSEGHHKIGETAESYSEVVVTIARLTAKAASLWRSLDAFAEVFEPIVKCLKAIPNKDNTVVTDSVQRVERLVHFSRSERRFLELQHFRPIGIITHAPLFDENYNPEIKGSQMDPERRELQKLKALHKKERKSTLREIRRDAEFEARQKLTDKRREMSEYHDKLKRLEGQINGEEGADRNAYEREKQKRKRR